VVKEKCHTNNDDCKHLEGKLFKEGHLKLPDIRISPFFVKTSKIPGFVVKWRLERSMEMHAD
jgi:hypothetical protein